MLAACAGCAFLNPIPSGLTLDTRLEAFPVQNVPLKGSAEVLWNQQQIPFIITSQDEDLPLVLGMVHTHLRWGQMELMRRLSQGRLAEMFGPFVRDVDHALRILDLGKAAPKIIKNMAPATRRWLERFAQGINFYIRHSKSPPPELKVLGLEPAPWTLTDLVTLGRLASADVNWLYWYYLLPLRREPAWLAFWKRLQAHGQASLPSFGPGQGAPLQLLSGAIKSGSNSVVVAGPRSQSGGALIASDPHVGLTLPNLWLIVGCKSPSYHLAGLSFPGLPAVVIGRNRNIAWGGTNMLSFSSSLYDISGPGYDRLQTRTEYLRVRWWPDRQVEVRDSNLGPVVSDAPFLEDMGLPRLALKWRGHQPSDELSALLHVNQARNWQQFRQAFASFAVSGQNFLFADDKGNIGQVMALEFDPAAFETGRRLVGDPGDPAQRWKNPLKSTDLPAAYNPAQGFLVSANNTPARTEPPVALLGNWNDRYLTLHGFLKKRTAVTVKDLMHLQQSVFSRDSLELARAVLAAAGGALGADSKLRKALAAWDGNYRPQSKGAAALELCAYHLASSYYPRRYGEKIAAFLLSSPAVYAFLAEDLKRPDAGKALGQALGRAEADLEQYDRWDKLHRLRLSHPLGRIPVLGWRFRFGGEEAASGSTNTVTKTAHRLSHQSHYVTYGANSRHISDLSDLDRNYFMLMGGQDGYWGSPNYLDLFRLWQQNRYVQVPLRLESVDKVFTRRMVLKPPPKAAAGSGPSPQGPG
jgi:penicillin amidase